MADDQFTQKQLEILAAFQNPQQSTDTGTGLGGVLGRDLVNLPSKTANSLMGSLNSLANMGAPEGKKPEAWKVPNLVDEPTMTAASPASSKVANVIAGGILPELAAVFIPYAGISKVAKVAGAGASIADLVGNIGTGAISGAREGSGEMIRQAGVFGALGPISKIESPLARVGAAAGLGATDYAVTQSEGASQSQSLGTAAFDLIAGSIPHGRPNRFANLQTPEIQNLPIDEILPPVRDRRALRITDGRDITGPIINMPARVNPTFPSDLSTTPQVADLPFDVTRDYLVIVPRPTPPRSFAPNNVDLLTQVPVGMEESLQQSHGKMQQIPEYMRTQGGGSNLDIFATLGASGVSGLLGGAIGGKLGGDDTSIGLGIVGGLALPWLGAAGLAKLLKPSEAELGPIFKHLKETGSIGGPAFKLPNGTVIADSTARHHYDLVDQIPNSIPPSQVERGFINEHGEFLTAHEANAEALLSGQISKKTFKENAQTKTLGLTTEDITPENSFATPFNSERGSVGSGNSAGTSNLLATIEKNIADAKMMQPNDPEGFLQKMADSALMKGNIEAESNFKAAIATLQNQKKIPDVSEPFKLKSNNESANTSIHTLLPLAGGAVGATAGYQEGGMERATAGAILGLGAGVGLGRLLDRIQLTNPASTVKLASRAVKSSVKSGLENAINSPAKDLGGQDVYGRGDILPKFFRGMEHLFNLGLPADLHSAITRARGFASDIVEQGNAALKQAVKFNPPEDIRKRVTDFIDGKLFTEGEQDAFLKGNGVLSEKEFKKLGITEREQYSAWTKPDDSKVYVPDGTREKFLTLNEKKLLEGIPEEWKEFANLQITARRSMNDFQRTILEALPEGYLRDKISDSIGRYVPRVYRFFTDNKHAVTDEQINKASSEFGLTKASQEIDAAINSRKAKLSSDYNQIMQELQGKSDLKSTERFQRLGKFQQVDVAGQSYHAAPEIVETLKKFSNEDFLRNEVRSYLAELKGNRQTFGSKGIDKSLFTEREDMGPAFRDLLGEYTDPTERMAMGLQKMYAPSQAAKLIAMARDMKIDDLPISFSGDKWAALNTQLKEEIARTTEPSKVASLQNQLDRLNAYKKLPSDIKFGEFSGLYVHRFLADHFSNDGRIWDTGLGRGMASFNTFFKTTHVPLNPISQLRQLLSMPVFAVIGKATPAAMTQAWDAYKGVSESVKRELIREGIWTADFIRGEVKAGVDNIMNGRYDSEVVKGLKKGYENILELYRIPDMMVRGGTYIAAKNRIALELGLKIDSPKVIQKAVEWTDRYTMNYDNLNRATRIARNIPFINPFISFQSEMLRILKNLAVDSSQGNIERLAVLGGVVALPELAMKVGEGSLTPGDQKQWEKMKGQLPPYMRDAYLVPIAKLQNGKFKYVSISPIIPQDNFQQSVKAMATGDPEALMAVNPFLSSDKSPLFNLISEAVTGESRQTGLKYRDTKEQLSSMVSEILPPLAPGGYEWKKLANVNVENLRSGKVENWGDIALRYTTGLSSGVLKPEAVSQSAVSKLKQEISNLREYYLRVVRTTSPDTEKKAAYDEYRQGVELLIHDFAEKNQPVK